MKYEDQGFPWECVKSIMFDDIEMSIKITFTSGNILVADHKNRDEYESFKQEAISKGRVV